MSNINNINDINDINDSNTSNTSNDIKNIKTKVTYPCIHCNKIFKNKKIFDNHMRTQVCINKELITYCKLCDLTLLTRDEYNIHMCSMTHLNNIGCNTIDILSANVPNAILCVDPYLSLSDAVSIGTNNIGSGCTFVFTDSSKQAAALETINPVVSIQSTNTNTNNNDIIQCDNNDKVDKVDIIPLQLPKQLPIQLPPLPTDKQKKILVILSAVASVSAGCAVLLRLLDNKLLIDDYNSLQYFIKVDTVISDELKTAYIELINKFINMLIKKKNAGDIFYKEKDISRMVILLTK